MRLFMTKSFARFSRREAIGDKGLQDAILRAERGLVDADLGGGLIKQRVARPGQGRSGGYRTVIAYRVGDRAFFMLGFAKGERDNIDQDEVESLKKFGARLLAANVQTIDAMLNDGALQEVHRDKEE
jgi:hypothetical protein